MPRNTAEVPRSLATPACTRCQRPQCEGRFSIAESARGPLGVARDPDFLRPVAWEVVEKINLFEEANVEKKLIAPQARKIWLLLFVDANHVAPSQL